MKEEPVHANSKMSLEEAVRAYVNGEISAEAYKEVIRDYHEVDYVAGARALVRARRNYQENAKSQWWHQIGRWLRIFFDG